MAPNSARPTMKPIALETLKTRLRKSSSGKTGSAARLSAKTKATSRSTPPTISASIHGEVHE